MSTRGTAIALAGATVLAGCSGAGPATHDTPAWDDLIEGVSSELHSLQPNPEPGDAIVPDPTDPTDPTATLTTSSPNAVPTEFSNLAVGQCLLWPYDASSALVDVAQVVPCDEPHYGEVYVVGVFPDGDYPLDAEQMVAASCEDDFENYVGIDYWSSVYYYDSTYPSESGWQSGVRGWRCYAIEADNENSGSIRGTGR